ncbi:MAG: hypothetical protein H6538_04225 [Bacteroidales bacterium]|nr:hypothetical protein [Bacteroidales bacterium]MCB8999889.1 hypothetical protein [Bacteroidales bacterium]
MKTLRISLMSKLFVIALISLLSWNKVSAQFIGATQIDQTAIEERKGNLSTYTVPGPATDQYSWQVVGGTVTVPAAGVTGSGTVADPYVVPFTVGLQTIKVQWPADNNTITSVAGNVSTQRKVAHATVACPSKIQSLDIDFWSAATIKINDADYEICSGDATLGPITVQFTGAPNFDYKYTVTGLDGVTGPEVVVTGATAATQTIALPANLVNTSTTLDQTYIVTLTEMNDSFTGLGTILDATFTVTVHPTVETGLISSDKTLTRR